MDASPKPAPNGSPVQLRCGAIRDISRMEEYMVEIKGSFELLGCKARYAKPYGNESVKFEQHFIELDCVCRDGDKLIRPCFTVTQDRWGHIVSVNR